MAKRLMVCSGGKEVEATKKTVVSLLRQDFRSKLINFNWFEQEGDGIKVVCKMSVEPTDFHKEVLEKFLAPSKIKSSNIQIIKGRKNISKHDAKVTAREAFLNAVKGEKVTVKQRQEKLCAAFESLKVLGIDLSSDPVKTKRGRTKGTKNRKKEAVSA